MAFLKKMIAFFNRANDDEITVYAAQSTYYLMLSVIPFLMILMSVMQVFFKTDFNEILLKVFDVMDPHIKVYLNKILTEVFQKPAISVISFSAITTLWSASRGFSAIERGIKKVYAIPKRKYFIYDILLSFLYTIIFAVILIFFLGVFVFGETIIYFIKQKNIAINISFFEYIMVFIVAVLFFIIVYASFSTRKIKIKYHIPGAIFTASGWLLFSYIFSVYINNYANYSRIYGSLTAIVLMMLWLYFCMIILLYGAEINMLVIKLISERD